jgi:HAE1 family hydrophobic/amphiphilic exporter-1
VKKKTKSFVPMLTILLSTAPVYAAVNPQDIPKEMLTLTTAVEYALNANPEVLKAREQIHEFDQLIRQARAEALPRVDGLVSVNRSRDPGLRNSPFFSRIIESGDVPPEALLPFKFTNYIWQFSVQQPVYTFGRVSNALRAARDEVEGIQLDVREVENRLSRDVARACYGYLLAKQQLEVLRTEQAARERQLEHVQARFDLEDATRLDLLQAQVTLNNLRPEILSAENNLQIAVAVVNDALGRPVDAPFDITLPLVLPESYPELDKPQELMLLANENRPELMRFQIDRKVLDSRVGVTRSNVLPEISANFSLGINTFAPENLTDIGFRSWAVGVGLDWTLFDGLRTNAEIEALRSQVTQNRFEEDSFRSELSMELERTTGTWTRALEAVEVARFAVEQAEEAQRVAEESFQWGAATTLDLLEAARALREAEFNLAQAAHEALVALAEIKYLVGFRADASNSVLELANPSEQRSASNGDHK